MSIFIELPNFLQIYIRTNRQTDRKTDRQTDRKTGRQTDKISDEDKETKSVRDRR